MYAIRPVLSMFSACPRLPDPAPLLHWDVPSFLVENFGCRTNQADGDALSARLEALGALPSTGVTSDIVVINTCSVTAEADRDARAAIRRAHRSHPDARILVTGCYAQRAPQEVAGLPGVSAVIGNTHKNQLAAIALGSSANFSASFVPLSDLPGSTPVESVRPFLLSGDIFAHSDFQLPSFPSSVGEQSTGRTRPSLKIQDGCSNRCTFCIIPSTRGNSRSLPTQNVLAAVQQFVASGGKELVLTGINLGRWGRDLTPQTQLQDLLAEIFETTSLRRLRISSVEPMDWTSGLIALFSRWSNGPHPRLARHIHMPLQSGSDAVLRRMHRRYRPWHYAERLAAVRAASPCAAIGADVMVGFPGETDAEFQETADFITAQPFTYLHLFPFSARPGTPAWELHQQHPVPGIAVRERMAALRSLIDQKSLVFRTSFLGETLSAVTLIPSNTPGSPSTALTDNFLPVELDRRIPPNTLIQVRIVATTAHGLFGAIVE